MMQKQEVCPNFVIANLGFRMLRTSRAEHKLNARSFAQHRLVVVLENTGLLMVALRFEPVFRQM